MDIAIAGAAAWIRLGADGRIAEARIVLASVGPTPVRATSAEQKPARRASDPRPVRSRRPARRRRCPTHLRHARLGRLSPLAGRGADGAGAGRLLRGAAQGARHRHEDAHHLHRQRRGAHRARRHARHAARPAARAHRADRHQGRLRQRQLRHLHGAGRRCRGQCLPGARPRGARARHRYHRGLVVARRAASDPARARRAWRHAMRLLHAGHRAVRQGAARRQPQSHAARRPPRHRRQHLPLHGLRQDRRRDLAAPRQAREHRRHGTNQARPQVGRQAAAARRCPRARDRRARSTRPTSSCPAWCTRRCCAARTRMPASAASTLARRSAEGRAGRRHLRRFPRVADRRLASRWARPATTCGWSRRSTWRAARCSGSASRSPRWPPSICTSPKLRWR